MTVRVSYEIKSGGWPNNVGVVRQAYLTNDLSSITDRRVTAIKIYNTNDEFIGLSLDNAKTLYERLGEAIIAAESGPLGDLAESTAGETRDVPTPGAAT